MYFIYTDKAISRQKFDVLTFLQRDRSSSNCSFFLATLPLAENLVPLVDRSGEKLLALSFPRPLQAFASIFDWFSRLTSSIVIGWIKN